MSLDGPYWVSKRKSKAPAWALEAYRKRVGPVLESPCVLCGVLVVYAVRPLEGWRLACEECVDAKTKETPTLEIAWPMSERAQRLDEELPRMEAERN